MKKDSPLFTPGQRWISEMEPELGLGLVTQLENRRVVLHFPAGECTRQYAAESAPLKRAAFREGDTITLHDGRQIRVQAVDDRDGLLYYLFEEGEAVESLLSDTLQFTTPDRRLVSGHLDPNHLFELRRETWRHLCRTRQSPVTGFLGARIDLIPHQLYIARETAGRLLPRVLLADEVGLGKTIEACLILHRLLVTGRASRALILVPPALVHQWFVELLRRFHLTFRIFDAPYCESLVKHNADANPFWDEQLILADISFLANQEPWHQHALDAQWDMVVVDEAHHLSPDSPEYRFIQRLSSPGLMLLTATPEQLGREGHFHRLRLLDPARYKDLKQFEEESRAFEPVAGTAHRLMENQPLRREDKERLRALNIPESQEETQKKRDDLLRALLDRHGLGRVMFRNHRSVVKGFPDRKAHLYALESTPHQLASAQKEFRHDQGDNPGETFAFQNDPRLAWLTHFLKTRDQDKALIICRTRQKARALEKALKAAMQIKAALFHEKMTLIQRDRNGAWFSEPDGARVLVSSEIGSEGRNFQFANHLILFDLPLNPELLEQRIGRLDRIGRKGTVHIHVPYLKGTHQEKLARWYQDGLNAFESKVSGAWEIFTALRERLISSLASETVDDFDLFIEETRTRAGALARQMDQGRDRLLELHSHRPDEAAALVRQIQHAQEDRALDRFMHQMWNHFGVNADPVKGRHWHLTPGHLRVDRLPGLSDHLKEVTFDRQQALTREDMDFITWDHPMVMGAMELLTGTEQGNAAAVRWVRPDPGIFLEAIFVLTCVAPQRLYVHRFLPPTPLRVVVSLELNDATGEVPESPAPLKPCPDAIRQKVVSSDRLDPMKALCLEITEPRANTLIENAARTMEATLHQEISRLAALKKVNPAVQQGEIDALIHEKNELDVAMSHAALRLDSLRLIVAGPEEESL